MRELSVYPNVPACTRLSFTSPSGLCHWSDTTGWVTAVKSTWRPLLSSPGGRAPGYKISSGVLNSGLTHQQRGDHRPGLTPGPLPGPRRPWPRWSAWAAVLPRHYNGGKRGLPPRGGGAFPQQHDGSSCYLCGSWEIAGHGQTGQPRCCSWQPAPSDLRLQNMKIGKAGSCSQLF